jgi:hypothetical protein
VMRSGAADGADRAFEKGVKKSRNKEIYRPSYDANKALPAGYLVIGGKKEAEARAIAAAVTTDFGKLDQFGQDLHTRNAFQVLGRDPTRPSEFVLAITKAGNDARVRGTRATMAIAAANGIPVYDLAQREQRTAFLERLTEMERTAGITHDGPVLAPAHGSLRAALPLKLDGIDPAKTISVRVLNVRDLEGKVRGDEVYVGRTKAVPGELGVQAVHDLGNPFIVGKDGLRGACADMYADYLGDKLAGDRDTQERVTALAEQAAKSGRLDLACHCAPGPCHADSIAVSIAEGLAARGFDVRTNLEPARYAALVPVQGLEAKAHEQLQQRHIEPSRAEGPWRKIEGEVIGADEHEAFVHIGDGKLRRIEQSRLGDSPLHEGVYATLVQTSQGLAQIKDDRANARALSPA